MSEGIKLLCDEDIIIDVISKGPFNEAYGGMNVLIANQFEFVFREGRNTPKKQGHFVTLWQKDSQGLKNIPYHHLDIKDGLIIYISDERDPGFFVVHIRDLDQFKILQSEDVPGKMGFRVYHPSIILASSQAQKMQTKMKPYFISISDPNFKNRILSYCGA
ncbi:MepB family protein [Erysipelothrix rhusiopathiae]|nr:MepB family protein [Erysipelothrix rhusiopathiae]MDE8314621.1 MepB family protein [Erysipelothrix rhusiopathiae]MDE8329953.1 MepB family protein [Erysipelothrix rhusiopathiae]MDE8333489.1 MepB family protein [Erysipelothrix rhusiopathiae]